MSGENYGAASPYLLGVDEVIKGCLYCVARINYIMSETFIENVIRLHHTKPKRKLAGLVQLQKSGREVRIGSAIDILLIDGERCDWRALEHPHNFGAFIL